MLPGIGFVWMIAEVFRRNIIDGSVVCHLVFSFQISAPRWEQYLSDFTIARIAGFECSQIRGGNAHLLSDDLYGLLRAFRFDICRYGNDNLFICYLLPNIEKLHCIHLSALSSTATACVGGYYSLLF